MFVPDFVNVQGCANNTLSGVEIMTHDTLVGPVELVGKDVNEFIASVLLPVVQGKPVVLFSAAALTLILCSIRPEIDDHELMQGLQDVSAYITIWVSEMDTRTNVQAGEPVARVN